MDEQLWKWRKDTEAEPGVEWTLDTPRMSLARIIYDDDAYYYKFRWFTVGLEHGQCKT